MQDRLCRTADVNWFAQNLGEIMKEVIKTEEFPRVEYSSPPYVCT